MSALLRWLPVALVSVLGACTSVPGGKGTPDALQNAVMNAARAFAKTMADRDHAAFASFVSEEAVFFTGPTPLRGREAVAAAWRRFFEGPTAPFSWEPDQVVVLASGTLASTSGPVRDPQGKLVARFNSVWRLEAPGTWRVIFDKGSPVCDCTKP